MFTKFKRFPFVLTAVLLILVAISFLKRDMIRDGLGILSSTHSVIEVNPHGRVNSSQNLIENLYPECENLTETQFWQLIDRRKSHINRTCRVYKEQGYKFHWKVDWNKFERLSHKKWYSRWFSNFLVFDKFKLLYQGIQKTGTTNFMRYIGNYNVSLENQIIGVHQLSVKAVTNKTMYGFPLIESVEDAKYKFESYYKVVFFREPLERVLSSYSYFANPNSTMMFPIYPMLKETRKLEQANREIENDLRSGVLQPLTVNEYLQQILAENDSIKLERYWRPQMINAMPCDTEYDFIGSTSAMSCEMKFLIKRLTGGFPKILPSKRVKPKNESPETLLSGVSPKLVNDVLHKHYVIDYDFLGYPLPIF